MRRPARLRRCAPPPRMPLATQGSYCASSLGKRNASISFSLTPPPVAQWLEHRAYTSAVLGSNPSGRTKLDCGGLWYNGITHGWGSCDPGSTPGSPTS